MTESLQYDVVCVGGGLAGVFAAITAARSGARVVLLERTEFLGGGASIGTPLCGLPTQRTPLTAELLEILQKLNTAKSTLSDLSIPVNGEALKLALHRLCRIYDIELLLSAEANEVCLKDGGVAIVKATGKNTVFSIVTSAAIDATGTGALLCGKDISGSAAFDASVAVTLTDFDSKELCRCKIGDAEEGFSENVPGTCYRGPLFHGGGPCTIYASAESGRFLVLLELPKKVNAFDPVSRTNAVVLAHRYALAQFKTLLMQKGFSNVRLSNVSPQLNLRKHLPDGMFVCGASALPYTCSAGTAISTGEAAGTYAAKFARHCRI